MGDSNFRPLARQRRFGSRRDSNSDRGTVKGTFWRRPSTTADDAQRPPITRETPILPGLIRRCGDDRRWRVKGGEGGVGALGEIRTPDPRIGRLHSQPPGLLQLTLQFSTVRARHLSAPANWTARTTKMFTDFYRSR